jgi:Zn-dependent protease with chaperone function
MSMQGFAPPRRKSLALLAGAAAVLVVFSYIVTLCVAAACVYVPFLAVSYWANFYTVIFFIAGIIVAGVILWSIVPRRDVFSPPGPRLSAADQPRLFAEIYRIAESLNEPIPAEVYLTLDVNAGVLDRGGIMGFGSQRVMVLGLPLIGVITISQTRAALGHEFGHYYTGDTRLLPWVHKTRAAMIRTIQNLGSDRLARAFERFGWAQMALMIAIGILTTYWKLFMRISQAISRKQEYRADELACCLAGSRALKGALEAMHKAAAAAPSFWHSEMRPAIGAGYRPPLADGFAQFIAAPRISKALAASLEAELKRPAVHPYDTHPPLRDRLTAASAIDGAGPSLDDTPAITLLDDVDCLELNS